MPLHRSAFRPAWWLRSPHAQTLWPVFARGRAPIALDTERLELDDGDFLDLFWSGPRDAPVILYLHGLEGSIRSHYATPIMHRLNEAGFRVCLMHFRNCGDEPNPLPVSYHSGKTDDPQRVLEHIRDTSGAPPFGALGISLGGNVLLKWLGEQGGLSPLRCAAAVSVPFRLDACADHLERGFSRIYRRHLVDRLRASYRRKFRDRPSPLAVDVDALETFRDFDDAVTAPLHGFAGVDDYYARCSSAGFLARISVPTLVLQARDDPFMPASAIPREDDLSPATVLELSAHGGHVGFVGGSVPWRPRYHLDERLARWFGDRLTGNGPAPGAS
jgi:uncharacterized protein